MGFQQLERIHIASITALHERWRSAILVWDACLNGTVQIGSRPPQPLIDPFQYTYTHHTQSGGAQRLPAASIDRGVVVVSSLRRLLLIGIAEEQPAGDRDRGQHHRAAGRKIEAQTAMAGTCIARMRARSPHCVCAVVDRRSSPWPFRSHTPHHPHPIIPPPPKADPAAAPPRRWELRAESELRFEAGPDTVFTLTLVRCVMGCMLGVCVGRLLGAGPSSSPCSIQSTT